MVVKIKDIPLNERPRERLIQKGVEVLNNEEILSIIINNGNKFETVKEIANNVLSNVEDITELENFNYNRLTKIDGIGPSKACKIIASIELGKRIYSNNINIIKEKMTSPNQVYEYYKYKLANKKQEYFYAIYLDNKKKIIGEKLLFIGTNNYSLVHPREVFKEAYLLSANAIICIHNHPSGEPFPSKEDIEITKKLIDIGKLLGIVIVDHIIITKDKYYSFNENNDI